VKPWMIWTAAGVLGIALAILAIPFVTSPDPEAWAPVVVRAGGSGSAGTGGTSGVADTSGVGSTTPTSANGTAAPPNNGLTPIDEPELMEPVDGFVNPARKAREDLLARPDMVMVRGSDSRWRAIVRTIADKPHDPAADHTMRRVEELRRDIEAYRRDPNSGNVEELVERQKHILGELKQSSYWGPELAQNEAQLDQSFQIYQTSPDAGPR